MNLFAARACDGRVYVGELLAVLGLEITMADPIIFRERSKTITEFATEGPDERSEYTHCRGTTTFVSFGPSVCVLIDAVANALPKAAWQYPAHHPRDPS